MNRFVVITAGLALLVLLFAQSVLDRSAEAQTKAAVQVPRYEVDPLWPKPLPNHWILGSAIGVWVDKTDHIWIIHRGASTLDANENALGGKQIGRAHV